MSAPDLIELTLPLVDDTAIALFVSKSGDAEQGVWLRKRRLAAYELTGLKQVFVIVARDVATEVGLA